METQNIPAFAVFAQAAARLSAAAAASGVSKASQSGDDTNNNEGVYKESAGQPRKNVKSVPNDFDRLS